MEFLDLLLEPTIGCTCVYYDMGLHVGMQLAMW